MGCNPPAPLSVGFPRQEDWSGLPFSPPGDLPDPGIEPVSSALAGRLFTTEASGKPADPLLPENPSRRAVFSFQVYGFWDWLVTLEHSHFLGLIVAIISLNIPFMLNPCFL